MVRQRDSGARRHIEQVLVRVEREDLAPQEGFRTVFDPADRGIAIFYRKRKLTGHERRAHTSILALRYATAKHERLCAAAERAKQRAHADVLRSEGSEVLLADLGLSGANVPERPSDLIGPSCRQSLHSRVGIT